MINFYSINSVIRNEMCYHSSQRFAMINYLLNIDKKYITDMYKNAPHGRYELYKTDIDNTALILWKMQPYHNISMHEHEAKCAFLVCSGRIREHSIKKGEHDIGIYTKGDTGFIDKNEKHSIMNTNDNFSTILHLYMKKIELQNNF